MIRAEHIYKSFDGRMVLEDISAVFEQGKTNLIIGQSGSGKTVLLKSLVGLHEVDSGAIYYDDTDFTALDFKARKEIRQHVGMIFQGGALLDSSTVQDNVKLPLDLFTDQSEEEKLERVNFCLRRVNLDDANRLYPAELSGGMIKRVAIARAIVLNPKYLFCDEPNSGLDPMTSVVIDNLIKEITEEYCITTIINTHDMNSVMEIGEKVIFIYQGKKWWEGIKNDILDTDNKELNDFVFASSIAKKYKAAEKSRLSL
ncbi:MAG: ATP-binding cassette domain-containing protein [Rikenellaceae bacterium]|nr:ATP-binding cassette domain-containing protein [Rikenellaceae bacterium]